MSNCYGCCYWDGSINVEGKIWCKYYQMWHDPEKTDCIRFESK